MTTILIIILWIICGIISKKLQSKYDTKKFNFDNSFLFSVLLNFTSSYPVHVLLGPIALINTICIDIL